jgi:uncharacterized protein involved in exopolysaccharide biosynthesis
MFEADQSRRTEKAGSLLLVGEPEAAHAPPPRSRLARALDVVRAERSHKSPSAKEKAAASRRPPLAEGLQGEPEAPAQRIADASRRPAEPEPAAPPPTASRRLAQAAENVAPATGPAPMERPVAQPVAAVAPEGHADPTTSEPGDTTWRPLIDPAKVVSGIVRSRWLIAACALAGAVIGVLVAINTPKTYEAAAEMLADPRDLRLVERELTQGGVSNEATLALVENQVRLLTSGTVLGKVVDTLGLDKDPEFNGKAGGGIRAMISSVRSLLSSSSGVVDEGRARALAITHLAQNLSVARGGRTFVIVVAMKTQDAKKSALIANTMTKVFLDTYGDLQSEAAGRAAGELTGKLDELRKSVEVAERKVETFKAEKDLIDAQGRLITDDEIVKLNEQLGVARARTLELTAKANSSRGVGVDDVLGGVAPEELSSAGMQELRAQYSALKGEADRVAVRLGPKHPQLQSIQAQLDGARAQIREELRRIVSAAQTELRRAVQLEQELSSRLAQLKVKQGDVSNDLVSLRELERDATAKRAVYESFLLRARETGEQQGINSANISIISQATPPLESLPPSRSTIVLMGTMAGLALGIGFGGLRGTLDGLQLRPGSRRRRAGVAPRSTMFDLQPTATDPAPQPGVATGLSTPKHEPQAEASVERTHAAITPQPQMPVPQAEAGDPPSPHPGHPYALQPTPYPAYVQAPVQPGVHPFGHPGFAAAPPPYYPPSGQPMSPAYWQAPYPVHQPVPPTNAPAVQPETAEADVMSNHQIDEIRAGLRECREAIRELAAQRSGRRYF